MRLKDARSFWRIMRSVSLREIEVESSRSISVALVGLPERRNEALSRLFPDKDPDTAHPLLRTFATIAEQDGFPQESGSFDLVLDAGGGWAPTEAHISTVSILELRGWEAAVERILDEKPGLALALGRRFAGLRPSVARRIIRETSMANAEFAMLNALPGIVPVLGLLVPTTIMGDMLILAKNQAMMLYRLAACYDLPLDLRARAQDAVPLLGGSFGWRALARELVGIVPMGVGLIARGVVAYAGTYALGEAMRQYYELGRRPGRAEFHRLYRSAIGEARLAVASLQSQMRRLPSPRALLKGRSDDAGDA